MESLFEVTYIIFNDDGTHKENVFSCFAEDFGEAEKIFKAQKWFDELSIFILSIELKAVDIVKM